MSVTRPAESSSVGSRFHSLEIACRSYLWCARVRLLSRCCALSVATSRTLTAVSS